MLTLAPGERAIFSEQKPAPTLDRPELNKLLVWQQGKVAIDDLSLAAAVAEMNRYSATRLILEQPQSEKLRMSGLFIAGQSMSFARAMARSYDRNGPVQSRWRESGRRRDINFPASLRDRKKL